MTQVQLSAHAEHFPRLRLHEPPDYEGVVLALHGSTTIRHWFEAGKLQAYRITWKDGLMSVAYKQKHDLCTGVNSVELHVISSSPLQEGAKVSLNGEHVGELSRAGTERLDVPIGTHIIQVEKAGLGSWSTEVQYDTSSPGYDRLPIPEDALRPR